jgi:nitronate monooxygenase
MALWLAEIDVLRTRIREMKSLTAKPFAINLRLDLNPEGLAWMRA